MKIPSYSNTGQWPKNIPPLNAQDKKIADDFMNYWLKILPQRYGLIEKFNHGLPAALQAPLGKRTLEIGAGRCSHVDWEPSDRHKDYYAVEFRHNIAQEARKKISPNQCR